MFVFLYRSIDSASQKQTIKVPRLQLYDPKNKERKKKEGKGSFAILLPGGSKARKIYVRVRNGKSCL